MFIEDPFQGLSFKQIKCSDNSKFYHEYAVYCFVIVSSLKEDYIFTDNERHEYGFYVDRFTTRALIFPQNRGVKCLRTQADVSLLTSPVLTQ